MRTLVGILALIVAAALPFRQAATQPSCKLQDLAIDAALGDPLAQHNLGVAFHRGADIPRDYSKAAAMWRLSSNAGVIESYNNLGHLICYGRGVKQDFAEGIRLWRVAAEKGFAESQLHIGEAYSDGEYLKLDYIEAYAWARSGRHYAPQMEDAQVGKAVVEMADKILNDVRTRLTEAQMREAERKAAGYIAKYGTK